MTCLRWVLGLSVLAALVASAGPAAWPDPILPADPLAPLDRFEEDISLAFAEARVNLSARGPEQTSAIGDIQALLASLQLERDAEARAIEARYASRLLDPVGFNRALAEIREGRQRLADIESDLAIRFPPPLRE